MLHFKGSNCRRSRGSTWYDRMDRLLMTLGFTKSNVDSNLFFKVEGERLVMLLLCVDGLLSRHGSVANLLGTREVCSRDPEEVQDDGLQGHDHTYGIKTEATE